MAGEAVLYEKKGCNGPDFTKKTQFAENSGSMRLFQVTGDPKNPENPASV